MATSVRGRPSPWEQGCSGLAGVSPAHQGRAGATRHPLGLKPDPGGPRSCACVLKASPVTMLFTSDTQIHLPLGDRVYTLGDL